VTRHSLNFRRDLFAEASAAVPVVLVTLNHPDWDGPARFSSDPTERISADPLRYGTTSEGAFHDFALMAVSVPDDEEDAPRATELSFENVATDMVTVVRSVPPGTFIEVRLVLVQSNEPDAIEEEFDELVGVASSWTDEAVTLAISREPILDEPCPAHRMTKRRFPALFR